MFECLYVCMCKYVYVFVCMCMYLYVCTCMYVCMYVCMHVCMYVCMYVFRGRGCENAVTDDALFHTAATMHLIKVAEHLGVILPASPPPPSPRQPTTVGRRGDSPGTRRPDGRSPDKCRISAEKKNQDQHEANECRPQDPEWEMREVLPRTTVIDACLCIVDLRVRGPRTRRKYEDNSQAYEN